MGLFSKKPTTRQQNDIDNIIFRIKYECEYLSEYDTPDIYFSSFENLYKELDKLLKYENMGFRFTPSVKSQYEQIVNSEEQNQMEFLERAFKRAYRKAMTLKTEKGRLNRMEAFFTEIESYSSYLKPRAIVQMKKLKTKYMAK